MSRARELADGIAAFLEAPPASVDEARSGAIFWLAEAVRFLREQAACEPTPSTPTTAERASER